MNRDEHLLSCLAEECAEVAQRASKVLRFGRHEVQPGQGLTNAQRLADELRDLLAVAAILEQVGLLPANYRPTAGDVVTKGAKIHRFMAISREQGVLDEE